MRRLRSDGTWYRSRIILASFVISTIWTVLQFMELTVFNFKADWRIPWYIYPSSSQTRFIDGFYQAILDHDQQTPAFAFKNLICLSLGCQDKSKSVNLNQNRLVANIVILHSITNLPRRVVRQLSLFQIICNIVIIKYVNLIDKWSSALQSMVTNSWASSSS